MMSARLLTEAGRIARSQPVTSIVVSLICAGVVLGTLATTGRTVGAERAVLARIDDAGTRTIQILDDRADPELDVATLQSLIALSGVEWAIGLGSIEDVRPGGLAGAEPVPARTLNGTATELRLAGNGQAGTQVLVGSGSQRRLGLAAAAGTLRGSTGSDYAITGTFTATGPLASLEDSVLIVGGQAAEPLRRIVFQVGTGGDVLAIAEAASGLIGPSEPGQVSVEVSDDLVLAQAVVRGELGGFGRAIVVQALAAGLVLMALAVLAGVNGRRRDFGRRRALGATRSELVGVIVAQALWSALPGVAVGASAGSALARTLSGSWPGWEFPLAVAVLTVLSAALSALVPAVLAAIRDPVVALRVP